MGTYTQTTTSGDTTTRVTYSCDKKSMQYTIMGEDIKGDFDFLKEGGSIQAKLDEVLQYIDEANQISAFNFEGSDSVSDINEAVTELEEDISQLKEALSTLHSAFLTDIDNVNAELETNFGHWIFGDVEEASRTTTTN